MTDKTDISDSAQLGMIDRGEDAPAPDADNSPLEWRGLPAFKARPKRPALVLAFETEAEREELLRELARLKGIREVPIAKKTGPTWSAPWPPREKEDLAALRFDFEDGS